MGIDRGQDGTRAIVLYVVGGQGKTGQTMEGVRLGNSQIGRRSDQDQED